MPAGVYEFILHQIPGAVTTAALLVLAHFVFWADLSRIQAYVVGCLCVGLGLALTGALTGDWTAVASYALHLGPGGLVIIGLWEWRKKQARDEAAKADALDIEEKAGHAERTW